MADRLFDRVLKGTGFVMAVDHDEYLFGIHNRTYTYGESGLRNEIHIVIEETAVGDDGVGGELFLTGTAGKR